ncbi:MAG: hypothetical protein OHK0048_01650 [Rhodoferax sp.]
MTGTLQAGLIARWVRFGLVLWLIGSALCAFSQSDLAKVPALTGPVLDLAQALKPGERDTLTQTLRALELERGAQVVVLIVNSTQPEDIAAYANRVANTWKIGRREVGDGVLLVVAVHDRKIRIEVAKSLEGAIPDLLARRIIDEDIKPHFKRADYAAGLNAGVAHIAALIRGENLAPPTPKAPAKHNSHAAGGGLDLTDWAIFLFIAVPLVNAVLRRLVGSRPAAILSSAAAGALAYVVTASEMLAVVAVVVALFVALLSASRASLGLNAPGGGWRGGSGGLSGGGPFGGGFGGSGGGGWSSGGGGDFGGGGASGDW